MFLPHFCPKDDGFPEDEGHFCHPRTSSSGSAATSATPWWPSWRLRRPRFAGSPSARSINTSRATGMTRGWSRCGMVWMEMELSVFHSSSVLGLCWDLGAMLRNTVDLDFWRWFVEKSVGCAIWVFSWPGKPYQSSVLSTGGNAHPSLGHSGVNHGHLEVGCWG